MLPKTQALVLAALMASAGLAHADLAPTPLTPSAITPPATVSFGNSNVTVGTINGIYNFLDEWTFSLASGSDVGAISTTFDFGAGPSGPTFGISNLQVKLVGGLGTLVSWLTVTPVAPGFTSSVALVPPSSLGAGNYTLQVRGTVGGSGAYGGSVIASAAAPAPVPLPAALPLLLLGLGALGGAGRRSRKV